MNVTALSLSSLLHLYRLPSSLILAVFLALEEEWIH